MLKSLSLLLLVVIAAFLLTGLSAWFARRQGMLDQPGERHSHSVATPRGGGLGIVLGLLLGTLIFPVGLVLPDFWWRCLLPGFVSLAVVGLLDDRYSLSVSLRLLVQVLASSYLLACVQNLGWTADFWLWIAATLFLIWMTNLYNFMDGSNGMAAMQAIFAGLIIAVLLYRAGEISMALLAASLAAANLGFLPWNLGKARVFMGDVGSVSLGYLIAGLLLYGVLQQAFSIAVAWIVMVVFLCDSTLTLLTRVIKRERWYTPHKQHIYQRLIMDGWSHQQVLWLYQSINVLLVIPVIGVAVSYPEWAEVLAISITSALAMAWLLALRILGVFAISGKKQ